MTPRTAIVASIARRLNRPVKLVATRDQGFTIATYRAETRHEIQLGASRDGKLIALRHEGCGGVVAADPYAVGGTKTTHAALCLPERRQHGLDRARRPQHARLHALAAGSAYMFALESAMDELAVKLNMDPIELRRINDTMKEPIGGKPYTSRSLMACFDEGAKAFGWSKRAATEIDGATATG